MLHSLPRLLLLVITLASAPLALVAADEKPSAAPAAPKLRQWLYILRLAPRLHDDKAWTETDKATIGRHFARLQAATKSGQVILAGRSMEPGDKTIGLVIFEAADEPAALAFMNGDPCVEQGVMTAELRPYAVALLRK